MLSAGRCSLRDIVNEEVVVVVATLFGVRRLYRLVKLRTPVSSFDKFKGMWSVLFRDDKR